MMNTRNKLYTILEKAIPLVIIAIFAVIGIIGYSFETSSLPIRTLFKSKGGYVIFSHQAHANDYGLGKCHECHHNMKPPVTEASWKCSKCHNEGSEYKNICEDKAPHQQCIGAKCVDCHTKTGMDPKECSFCHKL